MYKSYQELPDVCCHLEPRPRAHIYFTKLSGSPTQLEPCAVGTIITVLMLVLAIVCIKISAKIFRADQLIR